MRWEPIEDRICCLIFMKNHVMGDNEVSKSIDEAIYYGVKKPEGSVRMKLANIATLTDKYQINSSQKIKRLANYSRQNHDQFIMVTKMSLPDILIELSRIKLGT